MASGSKRLRIMGIQWESKCIHWMPTTASCSTIFGMQDARTSVTPHTSIYNIYIYGNGLMKIACTHHHGMPGLLCKYLQMLFSSCAWSLVFWRSCTLPQCRAKPWNIPCPKGSGVGTAIAMNQILELTLSWRSFKTFQLTDTKSQHITNTTDVKCDGR